MCQSVCNGLVSSINELVRGAGMVEFGCWREASSEFIFFSRRDRTMAATLPLSGHPCAGLSRC